VCTPTCMRFFAARPSICWWLWIACSTCFAWGLYVQWWILQFHHEPYSGLTVNRIESNEVQASTTTRCRAKRVNIHFKILLKVQ
jgi:hypothetical protein